MMRTCLALVVAALSAAVAPAAGAATLSRADRAAIDRTLDVFVPGAVARRHSDRAWPLATPAMRVGGTRAGWARGDLPIPPFPAVGRTFHGWTVDSVRPGVADLVLLLHARRGSSVGAISYDVRMRRIGGRWLVDSFVPAASFASAGSVSSITASPDFAPGPAGAPTAKTGHISGVWGLALPGVLLALIVLVPLVIFLVHRRRDRAAMRRYASATRGV
jgi:hypothetical protein